MNRWKRLPWWSTIFAVLAMLVIAIAGCGADESSTTATEAKKEEEDSAKKAGAESNPDRVARSYAREVSGGKWEYGGLSSAAYGGCLEALLGEHVGTPGVLPRALRASVCGPDRARDLYRRGAGYPHPVSAQRASAAGVLRDCVGEP